MNTTTEVSSQTTVAARVAGEDIKQGDYVTILSEIIEWPSWFWSCSSVSLPADEPVRVRNVPRNAGEPHEVLAICLPFVYVKPPRGGIIALDIRQQQLVRLDKEKGQQVWQRMQKKKKRK